MAAERKILGQVWLMPKDNNSYSLVQDEIIIVAGKDSYNKTTVLVEDIWVDLKKANQHQYKVDETSRGSYFYWEYKMTDTENEDAEVTVKFECPKPAAGVFTEPYKPEDWEGEYPKYWVARLKTAKENYEYNYSIQKKEIIIPGTSYIDPTSGSPKVVEEIREQNTDLGDITNLLNMF